MTATENRVLPHLDGIPPFVGGPNEAKDGVQEREKTLHRCFRPRHVSSHHRQTRPCHLTLQGDGGR